MSYYDPQAWQLPMRDTTWDQQAQSSSRSDANSAMQRETAGAFSSQFEVITNERRWKHAPLDVHTSEAAIVADQEYKLNLVVDVERAIDNLAKSGKLFLPGSRRDSMPMMGAGPAFSDFSPRLPGMAGRHHSMDFDQSRPPAGSGLQVFYANQRHQARPNEAEQMAQAKRRMAAQRERELRNYHQEQQYNRNASTSGKPDQPMSPSAINDEERHELIARQHRALYGKENSPYLEGGGFGDESHTPRPGNPTSGTSSAAGGRGPSPRTYDPFAVGQGQQTPNLGETSGQLGTNEQLPQSGQKGSSPNPGQQSSRPDSTSSPASNPPGQSFAVFESAAQQSSRTSTSSPGGSPPRPARVSGPGVAPIGTRPAQSQAANPALSKRSGTPSASPLSYSFAASESLSATANSNERSTSSASNPASGPKDTNVGGWGAPGSGPWGSNNNSSSNNKPLGVQASVWG